MGNNSAFTAFEAVVMNLEALGDMHATRLDAVGRAFACEDDIDPGGHAGLKTKHKYPLVTTGTRFTKRRMDVMEYVVFTCAYKDWLKAPESDDSEAQDEARREALAKAFFKVTKNWGGGWL